MWALIYTEKESSIAAAATMKSTIPSLSPVFFIIFASSSSSLSAARITILTFLGVSRSVRLPDRSNSQSPRLEGNTAELELSEIFLRHPVFKGFHLDLHCGIVDAAGGEVLNGLRELAGEDSQATASEVIYVRPI